MEINRRRLIRGLGLFAAGPAIMRVAAIMPISVPKAIFTPTVAACDQSTTWTVLRADDVARMRADLWAQELINLIKSQSTVLIAMNGEDIHAKISGDSKWEPIGARTEL